MEIKLFFGVGSSILAVVCFAPYIKDILSRKTEPHRYSWLVWTILQTVGVMAQIKEGAGYGAWPLADGAVFCFSIFLLSFKYGTKNISKFDVGVSCCFVGSNYNIFFNLKSRLGYYSCCVGRFCRVSSYF